MVAVIVVVAVIRVVAVVVVAFALLTSRSCLSKYKVVTREWFEVLRWTFVQLISYSSVH